MTFNDACEAAGLAFDAALKVAGQVTAAAKQAKKAAEIGDPMALRKAGDKLQEASALLREETTNAVAAWPFDESSLEAYLRDGYAAELMDAARSQGIVVRVQDDRLLAFPCLLKVNPADRSLSIDRKRSRSLRPSAVIAQIKAAQARKPRVAPDRFLEMLHRAYRMLAGSESAPLVPLARIYEALTLLPGSSADYSESEFLRDVYLLDRSGLTTTKAGAVISFPASTTTKGGRALSFTAPDGETHVYYGIRFAEANA